MVTVTFFRHGESEDNTKPIWAGWKDAPLSALGRAQASALTTYLTQTSTRFTHIYASPLSRAHSTGLALRASQPQPNTTPFTINPNLREQHFGAAEGNPWAYQIPPGETVESMIRDRGVYPVLPTRQDKFEGGESLDDLKRRAEVAMGECVLVHFDGKDGEGEKGDEVHVHVALASHGLCISECVAALVRLDPEADQRESYTGLLNTAWARVVVERREDGKGYKVQVTDFNRSEHLEGVVAPDPAGAEDSNADARAFFGGKAPAAQAKPDAPATIAHI